MRKHTKVKTLLSIILIVVELTLIVATVFLYRFDTNEKDLSTFKRFALNEYESVYSDDALFNYATMSSSVSDLYDSYSSHRLTLELDSDVYSYNVSSLEEADKLYDMLVPESVEEVNIFLRYYIMNNALGDVMRMLDKESPGYYYIKCKLLTHLRFNDYYLYHSKFKFLYINMSTLILILISMQALFLIMGIYMSIYYYHMSKYKENKNDCSEESN